MKKLTGISLFIFFCVVSAILTAGLVFYSDKKNNTDGSVKNQVDLTKTLAGVSVLDYKEVAKHNTISDCWMVINNKVYNLSGYSSKHPGGSRDIANYCGKESTGAFDTKGGQGAPHSTRANGMLSDFFLGNLNEKIDQKAIQSAVIKTSASIKNTTTAGEEEDD